MAELRIYAAYYWGFEATCYQDGKTTIISNVPDKHSKKYLMPVLQATSRNLRCAVAEKLLICGGDEVYSNFLMLEWARFGADFQETADCNLQNEELGQIDYRNVNFFLILA